MYLKIFKLYSIKILKKFLLIFLDDKPKLKMKIKNFYYGKDYKLLIENKDIIDIETQIVKQKIEKIINLSL